MSEPPPITRADIESKFRELQGGVDEVEDDIRSYATTVVTVVVVAAVVVAFWLGRRKSRSSRTFVEVRRL
jgi:hypothetical protein